MEVCQVWEESASKNSREEFRRRRGRLLQRQSHPVGATALPPAQVLNGVGAKVWRGEVCVGERLEQLSLERADGLQPAESQGVKSKAFRLARSHVCVCACVRVCVCVCVCVCV